MRCLGILIAAALCAAAQTPRPAVIRGVLLERDTPAKSGEFSVRLSDNEVLRYQFDWKTYVLRDNDLIDMARISPGERVEVVSDEIPGFVLRYARTVHVLADVRPPRPATLARRRYGAAERLLEERALPLGAITYAGVVFRITEDRLVLHTREGREQSVLLRKDTRYLQNGEIVAAEALPLNTRVFVRAGKDLWDQIEAYQVIWGRILQP